MKIVVSPNPYRDKQFKNARQACSILREAGAEVALCLPFDAVSYTHLTLPTIYAV